MPVDRRPGDPSAGSPESFGPGAADPAGWPGLDARDADEPDRDALGALASGDADWVAAAERATGVRRRRRRDDSGEAEDDMTREFWGATSSWRPTGEITGDGIRRTGRTTRHTAETARRTSSEGPRTGALSRVLGALSGEPTGGAPLRRRPSTEPRGGRVERTRTHRVVTPTAESDGYEFAGHDDVARHDVATGDETGRAETERDEWSDDPRSGAVPPVPVGPRRASAPSGLQAVDPLLRRVGALVMVAVVLVPVVLSMRSSDGPAQLRDVVATDLADALPVSALGRTLTGGATGATESGAGRPEARQPGGPAADDAGVEASADARVSDDSSLSTGDEAVATPAAMVACEVEYTIAPGDYWLRLAEESGVPLADLLAANGATIETAIHPGDDVCLPEGATVPSPPPTTTAPASNGADAATGTGDVTAGETNAAATAPATTAPPTTSAPATTAAPATTPPATAPAETTPPTTTAPETTDPPAASPPASSANPSASEVRAIIREVWPDDEHEMAITVARRESTFRANAYNGWCCHGIFQIHWEAHRSWLNERGITSPEQLYDARTNVELAYQIFQRSGGWGPWSATAH